MNLALWLERTAQVMGDTARADARARTVVADYDTFARRRRGCARALRTTGVGPGRPRRHLRQERPRLPDLFLRDLARRRGGRSGERQAPPEGGRLDPFGCGGATCFVTDALGEGLGAGQICPLTANRREAFEAGCAAAPMDLMPRDRRSGLAFLHLRDHGKAQGGAHHPRHAGRDLAVLSGRRRPGRGRRTPRSTPRR
jgi:hypothetical protein